MIGCSVWVGGRRFWMGSRSSKHRRRNLRLKGQKRSSNRLLRGREKKKQFKQVFEVRKSIKTLFFTQSLHTKPLKLRTKVMVWLWGKCVTIKAFALLTRYETRLKMSPGVENLIFQGRSSYKSPKLHEIVLINLKNSKKEFFTNFPSKFHAKRFAIL